MAKIGASGTKHTYSIEEKEVFVNMINETLKDDEMLIKMGKLPIDPKTDQLFKACDDGVIFIKLANKI